MKKHIVMLSLLLATASAQAQPDCEDGAGDSLQVAEVCAQQEFDERNQTMEQLYRSLLKTVPAEDRARLELGQNQWLAFRTSHCRLFEQLAGRDNPAWQMSWSQVAVLSCESDLTQERNHQLSGLSKVLEFRSQQNRASETPE